MRLPQRGEEEVELGARAAGSGDAEEDEDAGAGEERADEATASAVHRGSGAGVEGKEPDAAPAEPVPTASDPPEHREGYESEEDEEFPEEEEEEEADYIAPGSPQEISAAEGLETTRGGDGSSCDDDKNDFEFPSVCCDRGGNHDGDVLVRRVYPVFDRELFRFYLDEASRELQRREAAASRGGSGQETHKSKKRMALGRLMMEEDREPSTSSSEADDLEGLSPDSYCLWTPGGASAAQSPRRRKSNSTGGTGAGGGRKWRLRDLVIGRSHSDGKKKFLYLASEEDGARGEGKERKGKKQEEPAAAAGRKKKTTIAAAAATKKGARMSAPMEEVDLLPMAHHRINHGAASPPPPYHRQKDNLGGLFANVNGATRRLLHPF